MNRREELLDLGDHLKHTWDTVREPVSEYEEVAQKSAMWQGMDRLDRRKKEEIEAIDRALAKMDLGHYGHCERCGRDIEIKRLKLLPSTNLCKRCAKRQEMGDRDVRDDLLDEDEDLPLAYEDMDDEALSSAIFDKVQEEGRIETEELEVSCEDGVVYLNGSVANEMEHRLLLELVEDRMALRQGVVDNLKIGLEPLDEEEDREDLLGLDDEE
jgi:RNA polymerase-binding transcription factor DksA